VVLLTQCSHQLLAQSAPSGPLLRPRRSNSPSDSSPPPSR
jgi:hypothetical protein